MFTQARTWPFSGVLHMMPCDWSTRCCCIPTRSLICSQPRVCLPGHLVKGQSGSALCKVAPPLRTLLTPGREQQAEQQGMDISQPTTQLPSWPGLEQAVQITGESLTVAETFDN